MFVLLQRLLPQHLLSRIVGFVANSQVDWIKNSFIRFVIKKYQPNLEEALSPHPEDYASFNAFFTRGLKPGVRPISGPVCSPADGVVSACGPIDDGMLIQAKGIDYSLEKLLATNDVSAYSSGSFATVYLSPKDYHRVHNPIAGQLVRARYVPGKLFSVNQATTEGVEDLFAINERLVMDFETTQGKVCVIMVGAMIVAAVKPVWREQVYQAREFVEEVFDVTDTEKLFACGAELGEFQMGSTAIIVSEQAIDWSCQAGSAVQMGQSLLAS